MTGLSRHSWSVLDRSAHIAQSIVDILSTPIGSRVMLRAYGSRLPRLIDAPIGPALFVDLYQAVAEALDAWEPRVKLDRCQVLAAAAGAVTLLLQVTDVETGRSEELSLEVVS